jgi:hypothetical protein
MHTRTYTHTRTVFSWKVNVPSAWCWIIGEDRLAGISAITATSEFTSTHMHTSTLYPNVAHPLVYPIRLHGFIIHHRALQKLHTLDRPSSLPPPLSTSIGEAGAKSSSLLSEDPSGSSKWAVGEGLTKEGCVA